MASLAPPHRRPDAPGLPARWGRLAPIRQDRLIAGIATVVGLGLLVTEPQSPFDGSTRSADALGASLVVLASLPLAWRRRAPLGSLGPMFLGSVMATALGYTSVSLLWFTAAAVASAVVHSRHRVAWPLAFAGAVVMLGTVLLSGDGTRTPITSVGAVLVGAFPACVGYALRTQRALAAELAEQGERRLRMRAVELERAVAEERVQVAREVHDIVGHHLSAINLQAGAGRRVSTRSGGTVTETFSVIERLSSQALHETRQMLGALRGVTSALDPLPGLADLEALLARVRAAGVEVRLATTGEVRSLPTATDACAYRVVQEALTNVAKHAHHARASVCIDYRPSEVRLTVRDHELPPPPGSGRRPRRPGHQAAEMEPETRGYGLLGLRERVTLLGGRVEAGPRSDGWQVDAALPIRGDQP